MKQQLAAVGVVCFGSLWLFAIVSSQPSVQLRFFWFAGNSFHLLVGDFAIGTVFS